MFFELKITENIEIRLEGTGNERLATGTNFFIAIGVLPVEPFAYRISMVSAAN